MGPIIIIITLFFLMMQCCVVMGNGCHSDRNEDHRPRVSCVNRGLTAVPEGIGPQTEVLILKQNQFSIFSWSVYTGFPQLHELDLSYNHITVLEPPGPELENLSVLHLSGNRLTGLGGQVFRCAPGLMKIYLDGNEIRSLHDDTFSKLPRLEVIDLSRNKLPGLPTQLLERVSSRSLKRFDLENNSISFMPDNFFSSKPELPYVFLSLNPWLCNCAVSYLHSYLNDQEHNIYIHHGTNNILLTAEEVLCARPPHLARRAIIELKEEDFCPPPETDLGPLYSGGDMDFHPLPPADPHHTTPLTHFSSPTKEGSSESSYFSLTLTPTVWTTTSGPHTSPEPSTEIPTQDVPESTTDKTLNISHTVIYTSQPDSPHTEPQTITASTTARPKPLATGLITARPKPPTTGLITARPKPPATGLITAWPKPPTTGLITARPKPPTTGLITARPKPPTTGPITARPKPPATGLITARLKPPTTGLITARPKLQTTTQSTDALLETQTIQTNWAEGAHAQDVDQRMLPWCWWLFAGFVLLCVLSALSSCFLFLWLLKNYLTLYRQLKRHTSAVSNSSGIILRAYRRTENTETQDNEGQRVTYLPLEQIKDVQAVFRSVLFISKGEDGDYGQEMKKGARDVQEAEATGRDVTTKIELVSIAEERDKQREDAAQMPRGEVFRKSLYRLISQEEERYGWREEEESWRRETSMTRYSLILREQRGSEGEERRREMEWLVGEWEMGGRGVAYERSCSLIEQVKSSPPSMAPDALE